MVGRQPGFGWIFSPYLHWFIYIGKNENHARLISGSHRRQAKHRAFVVRGIDKLEYEDNAEQTFRRVNGGARLPFCCALRILPHDITLAGR